MTRTGGYCQYGRKLFKFSTLFVYSQPKEEVRKVILHEMAHAVTPGHAHDSEWQEMCIEFGGDGQQYMYNDDFREFACKLRMDCPHCGQVYFDNRDERLFKNALCSRCHTKVVLKQNAKYYKNILPANFKF